MTERTNAWVRQQRGSWLLIVHLAATAFMAGVIWYVQLVHYPLMEAWPQDDFARWEEAHRGQTGLIVVPAMLVEGLAAALILSRPPLNVDRRLAWTGAWLLLAIWASTFLIQVPLHERLSAGWDPSAHAWLVQSNWIRTVLWSGRMVVAALMLHRWATGASTASFG